MHHTKVRAMRATKKWLMNFIFQDDVFRIDFYQNLSNFISSSSFVWHWFSSIFFLEEVFHSPKQGRKVSTVQEVVVVVLFNKVVVLLNSKRYGFCLCCSITEVMILLSTMDEGRF